MHTIAAEILTELTSEVCKVAMVYELELKNGTTARFASRALTWGGNAYTATAVSATDLVEYSDGKKVSEVTVTFSNVTFQLRGYLIPTDNLTGGFLTLRLLALDANGTPKASSHVRFRGLIEKPKTITEDVFEVTAIGFEGATAPLPPREFGIRCPFNYKDGIFCTTTNPASTCDRHYSSAAGCIGRVNTHQFGGFLVVDLASLNTPVAERSSQYGDVSYWNDYRIRGEPVGPRQVIPLLYGIRVIRGYNLESGIGQYLDENGDLVTRPLHFRREFALSEGPIEGVVHWFDRGVPQLENKFETVAGPGSVVPQFTPILTWGFWYLPGDVAVSGRDYYPWRGPAGFHQTRRDQKTYGNTALDLYFSGSDPASYNFVAVANLIYGPLTSTDITEVPRFVGTEPDPTWLVKGLRVYEYDGNGNKLNGGAKVFSRNPIWIAIDLLTSDRYGLGQVVEESDIDWSVAAASAAYCDATVGDPEASTTVAANTTSSAVYPVDSTQGFYSGQDVLYNGSPDTVVSVDSLTQLTLGTARSASIGDTIAASTNRFYADLYIDKKTTALAILQKLLTACRGFLTYNEGKLQLRIWQAVGSSGLHFKDSAAAEGYGILQGSFQYVPDRDPRYNRVFCDILNNRGEEVSIVETDWDHWSTNEHKDLKLDGSAIVERGQGVRVARFHLSRAQAQGNRWRFTAGPAALQVQIGDRITVTHVVPNWTAQDVLVIGKKTVGLGNREEFFVELEVEVYEASIYTDDGYDGQLDINPPSATVNLYLQSNTWEAITVYWELEDLTANFVREWWVFRSPSTYDPDPPYPGDRIAVEAPYTTAHTYIPQENDIGEVLYFRVAAILWDSTVVYSNELTVRVQGYRREAPNLVYGGDFNDPRDWDQQLPTETPYPADGNAANTPEDDAGLGTYTSPLGPASNAQNNTTSDWALGTFSKATGYSEGSVYSWSAGWGDDFGVLELRARVDYDQAEKQGHWEWSYDTGGGYSLITQRDNSTFFNYQSAVEKIAHAGLNVKVRAVPELGSYRGAGTGTGQFAWCRFVHYTGGFAVVRGDRAAIRSDNTANWWGVHRQFPGQVPPDGLTVVMRAGDPYALRVAVWLLETGPVDAPFEIALWNVNTDQYWTLFTIDGVNNDLADITTDETHFATVFVPATDVTGPCRVIARSKSTKCIAVDQLGIFEGVNIPPFITSVTEQGSSYTGTKAGRMKASFGRATPPDGPYDYLKVVAT